MKQNSSDSRTGRTYEEIYGADRAAIIKRNKSALKPSEITKMKMSESHKGTKHTEAAKRKMSALRQGILPKDWNGYIRYLPYCSKFNSKLKEQIRNRDNRTCVLCGKGEIQEGRRLSVHHIDADKMQGCNGQKWYLCALCVSCNSKSDTIEKEFLIVSNLVLEKAVV